MSDYQPRDNQRDNRVILGDRDGLFELAAGLVGGVARMGLTVASVPLILLPRNSRRRVRRAMGEVARAVVALPKELADVSERVVDDIYAGDNDPLARPRLPRSDDVSQRARAFTERLSRAADEFGASVGRVSESAGDRAEQAAARVDEWVERPAAEK